MRLFCMREYAGYSLSNDRLFGKVKRFKLKVERLFREVDRVKNKILIFPPSLLLFLLLTTCYAIQ